MDAGPDKPESLRSARRLRDLLRNEPIEAVVPVASQWVDMPDILYALSELLEPVQSSEVEAGFLDARHAYELSRALSWDDLFWEKDTVSARLAFILWNHCRRFRTYAESQSWAAKCSELVMAQDPIRDFLALPTPNRSAELTDRFLGDPVVLMCACRDLFERRDEPPLEMLEEVSALHRWVIEKGAEAGHDPETLNLMLAWIAMSGMCASMNSGHFGEWVIWSGHAERHVAGCRNNSSLVTIFDHLVNCKLFLTRRYEEAISNTEDLVARFRTLGMSREATRALFLRGFCLAELGNSAAATELFKQTRIEALRLDDHHVAAMSSIKLLELSAGEGDPETTMAALKEATASAARSGLGWVVAHLVGTLGEILRDRGQIELAVQAYRSAASKYEELAMEALESYMRIVLAETLMLADRAEEATAEILLALPVIKREHLAREAAVAVGLLKEVGRRFRAKPEALKALHEQLAQLGGGGLL